MNTKIKKAVLRLEIAALPLALAGLLPSAALAQEAQPADCAESSVCDANGNDVIVVTGSRIGRSALVGSEPTVSLGSQYFDDRNITNVADALNENPVFRNSVTPAGTQSSYGNGVNFVNTFGIGSNRTLTLVNGRRVVSSNVSSLFGPGGPGVQVDLNVIPSIMVSRIDEIAIGGAPVYGADAIAGTVNIILKKKYDGVTFSAKNGISSRGDARNYNLSALAGQNFAGGRGNITLAVSYDNQEGVRGTDRKHITDNIGFLNNCTSPTGLPSPFQLNPNIRCNTSTTDGVPARILYRDLHSPYLSSTGVLSFTGLQFDNAGRLTPVGSVSRLTGFFGAGGNTYQVSDQTQVTSDLERLSAFATAEYEISDGVTLFAEGLYYRATAKELGTSPSFNTFVFDPDVSGGLDFDTATVPFLNSADRQLLLSQGITEFNLSRSNEDLFDQSASSKTELKRAVIGLRGEFSAINRNFNYEVSFNYGDNKVRNFARNINQQRFINAVSIAQGPNGPVCSLTPAIPVAAFQPIQPVADANCKPLNLFGFRQASPEALAYIAEDTVDVATLRQIVFNANIGGDLFDLWAGPAGFNIGYEHRDEKARFTPALFNQQGLGRNSAIAPTGGQYNLDEAFGEILVPLASPDNNIGFIHSAEIFGRGRYVHNTVNGGFVSWAAGGKLSPISGIEFRGNFTRSFRAPAITELYLPQSPTFERPADRCTAAAIGAGPVPTTRTANCTAFLSAVGANPATYTLLASQASVAGLSGGNPNLDNEKADSYTFGVILQPKFISGLTLTADYVNIKITGPIVSLTAADLTSGCFDNPNFNTADPRNGNQFCSALGFDATGQIPNSPTNPAVRTGYVNGQGYKFSAIIGAMDYVTSLDKLGIKAKLRTGIDAMWVEYRLADNTGVSPVRSDGLVDDPKFSAQARIGIETERFAFNTYVNFVGQQLTATTNRGANPNDTREFDHYKPYATVNANLAIKAGEGFRLNLSVTNLFDRIGETYYGYIVPASVNDDIGRRFAISVQKEF